jgi:hypothetical protein
MEFISKPARRAARIHRGKTMGGTACRPRSGSQKVEKFCLGTLSLKMREPSLSETPAAFRKTPNRSGGAGRKGVEGERNSRAALASESLRRQQKEKGIMI